MLARINIHNDLVFFTVRLNFFSLFVQLYVSLRVWASYNGKRNKIENNRKREEGRISNGEIKTFFYSSFIAITPPPNRCQLLESKSNLCGFILL